jgi:hypothetical protein
MRFICHIELPPSLQRGGQRLAYVFMSDFETEGQTWDPEFGDNAVIVQPGPFKPHVRVEPHPEGPTLERMVPGPTGNRLIPREVEYRAELQDLPDELGEDKEFQLATRIGGPPGWLQNDDSPGGGPWKFLLQIDSATDLYSINFGDAGLSYVFVADSGEQARFLWQCC